MFFFKQVTPDRPSSDSLGIPKLKVLDDMVARVKEMPIDFEKTVIFAVQHHLDTTTSLYLALQKIGIKRIYSIGKYYSTSEVVEERMAAIGVKVFKGTKPTKPGSFAEVMRKNIQTAWAEMLQDIEHEDIEKIIILDDGGRALELMPNHVILRYKVSGVEQTQAGLYSEALKVRTGIPIVHVASSAIKKMLEPPLIAVSAIQAVQKLELAFNFNRSMVFGVIGYGAIGKAITNYLVSKGFHVFIYDLSESALNETLPENVYRKGTIEDLIISSNCVFGCTGKDVTAGISERLTRMTHKDVILVSVSSEDKEFHELLQLIKKRLEMSGIELNPLDDVRFRTEALGRITIVAAGTPINFLEAKHHENILPEDIAITRGALFGAIIQAYMLATSHAYSRIDPVAVKLDANIQRTVVGSWEATAHHGDYSPHLLERFTDPHWIAENSGGQDTQQPLLEKHFSLAFSPPRARL